MRVYYAEGTYLMGGSREVDRESEPLWQSQVAIAVLRNTGTDPH